MRRVLHLTLHLWLYFSPQIRLGVLPTAVMSTLRLFWLGRPLKVRATLIVCTGGLPTATASLTTSLTTIPTNQNPQKSQGKTWVTFPGQTSSSVVMLTRPHPRWRSISAPAAVVKSSQPHLQASSEAWAHGGAGRLPAALHPPAQPGALPRPSRPQRQHSGAQAHRLTPAARQAGQPYLPRNWPGPWHGAPAAPPMALQAASGATCPRRTAATGWAGTIASNPPTGRCA